MTKHDLRQFDILTFLCNYNSAHVSEGVFDGHHFDEEDNDGVLIANKGSLFYNREKFGIRFNDIDNKGWVLAYELKEAKIDGEPLIKNYSDKSSQDWFGKTGKIHEFVEMKVKQGDWLKIMVFRNCPITNKQHSPIDIPKEYRPLRSGLVQPTIKKEVKKKAVRIKRDSKTFKALFCKFYEEDDYARFVNSDYYHEMKDEALKGIRRDLSEFFDANRIPFDILYYACKDMKQLKKNLETINKVLKGNVGYVLSSSYSLVKLFNEALSYEIDNKVVHCVASDSYEDQLRKATCDYLSKLHSKYSDSKKLEKDLKSAKADLKKYVKSITKEIDFGGKSK